jgi:hypothetical protein
MWTRLLMLLGVLGLAGCNSHEQSTSSNVGELNHRGSVGTTEQKGAYSDEEIVLRMVLDSFETDLDHNTLFSNEEVQGKVLIVPFNHSAKKLRWPTSALENRPHLESGTPLRAQLANQTRPVLCVELEKMDLTEDPGPNGNVWTYSYFLHDADAQFKERVIVIGFCATRKNGVWKVTPGLHIE